MSYDLYGNYYPNAIDAFNAEMAQCAEIDARLAYKSSQKLEQKYSDSQFQEHQMQQKIEYLMDKINLLEQRIIFLESNRQSNE